jgi:microcystin-dependent protein
MPAPQYVIRSYGGGATEAAQLIQTIGSTDTSFSITPTTGWVETAGSNIGSPLGTSGPFTVAVDRFAPSEEKILCSAINLSTGVVTVYVDPGDGWSGRGYDSTSAQAHVPGTTTAGVSPVWSATEAEEANAAVHDMLGGGGGFSVSVPIGTLIPFAGTALTLPTNFLVADASAVSRTSYSALFTAITIPVTGTTTTGGATITAVSSSFTPYITGGMQVTLTNSGGAVYTVSSVASTSIVLTSGTGITAGTGGAIVVYPHGAGDGSTTFNLPDARGRVIAGQSSLGTNSQPSLWVGGGGGEKLHTLVQNELSTAIGTAAAQAATVTDPTHYHQSVSPGTGFAIQVPSSTEGLAGVGTIPVSFTAYTAPSSTYVSVSNAASSVSNSGGGNGHNNMQPYLVATHIVRVA